MKKLEGILGATFKTNKKKTSTTEERSCLLARGAENAARFNHKGVLKQ